MSDDLRKILAICLLFSPVMVFCAILWILNRIEALYLRRVSVRVKPTSHPSKERRHV